MRAIAKKEMTRQRPKITQRPSAKPIFAKEPNNCLNTVIYTSVGLMSEKAVVAISMVRLIYEISSTMKFSTEEVGRIEIEKTSKVLLCGCLGKSTRVGLRVSSACAPSTKQPLRFFSHSLSLPIVYALRISFPHQPLLYPQFKPLCYSASVFSAPGWSTQPPSSFLACMITRLA